MSNITLSVSPELKQKMKRHPEIRWSRIAEKAIADYVELLDLLDKSTDSNISEEEAIKLAIKIHQFRKGKGDWRKYLKG